METFFWFISLYGIFTLAFSLFSLFIKEKLFISETVIFTIFGMFIRKTNIFIFTEIFYRKLLFYLSRLVISLQVVAVGSIVPFQFFKKNWRKIFILIGPVMIFSYFISTIIIFYLTDLTILESLIISACVTPTDPVLASSILKGKFANRYIPKYLRNLLIVEGGINDGLAYPLLMIPLFCIKSIIENYYVINSDNLNIKNEEIKLKKKFIGNIGKNYIFSNLNKKNIYNLIDYKFVFKEFLYTLAYEIVFACFLGLFIGYVCKKMLLKSKEYNFIDKENYLCFLLSVSLLVTGITGLLMSDDILASFFCGLAFSYTSTSAKVDKMEFYTDNSTVTANNREFDSRNQNSEKINFYSIEENDHSQNYDMKNSNSIEDPEDYDFNSIEENDHIIDTENHKNEDIENFSSLEENDYCKSDDQKIIENNDYLNTQKDNFKVDEVDLENIYDKDDVHNQFYEILDILLNSLFFLIFGHYLKINMKYCFLSIILILFKRLPLIFLFNLRLSKKEKFFAGFYGPIGVGAIFFISHFIEHLKLCYYLEEIVYNIVFFSVIIHGTTAIVIKLALRRKRI